MKTLGLFRFQKIQLINTGIMMIANVKKLKVVALLRDLDFSINHIRSIMNGNTSLLEELQKQEFKFEDDFTELQKKTIIHSLT